MLQWFCNPDGNKWSLVCWEYSTWKAGKGFGQTEPWQAVKHLPPCLSPSTSDTDQTAVIENGGSWQNHIIATTNSHLPRDTPAIAVCWRPDRMNSTLRGRISAFARRFWRTETICFLAEVIYGGFFGSFIWSKNKFCLMRTLFTIAKRYLNTTSRQGSVP